MRVSICCSVSAKTFLVNYWRFCSSVTIVDEASQAPGFSSSSFSHQFLLSLQPSRKVCWSPTYWCFYCFISCEEAEVLLRWLLRWLAAGIYCAKVFNLSPTGILKIEFVCFVFPQALSGAADVWAELVGVRWRSSGRQRELLRPSPFTRQRVLDSTMRRRNGKMNFCEDHYEVMSQKRPSAPARKKRNEDERWKTEK